MPYNKLKFEVDQMNTLGDMAIQSSGPPTPNPNLVKGSIVREHFNAFFGLPKKMLSIFHSEHFSIFDPPPPSHLVKGSIDLKKNIAFFWASHDILSIFQFFT